MRNINIKFLICQKNLMFIDKYFTHLTDEVFFTDMSADVAHRIDGFLQHSTPGFFVLPIRRSRSERTTVCLLASPTSRARLQLRAFGSQLWVVVAVSVPSHAQQSGQFLKKEVSNPWRHWVVSG